jgi:cation:H+ antiporter
LQDERDLSLPGAVTRSFSFGKSFLLVVAGLVGLMLHGKWIVDGAVKLAGSFGMSELLVGLTIVAVGTSLPELATSAMAAYKKKCRNCGGKSGGVEHL